MDEKFMKKVIIATPEYKYVNGEKTIDKGHWVVELECGHKHYSKTHANCKTHPDKKFCGQCWEKEG